ncbi:hypothetical protein LOTGIDRAFT_165795 [Lottia gigantea]|uniref:Uncharacterized protein n=1 Tax=Lottia gigantea TaxID=225164 RepID=V3ZBH7_LOTGI|nr:hypothetical protein LOTGIDRAFT_165795 [Lottia gigantea]ESO88353.1 hypothetical protein LOTGIDRAFT_165795 [Lottia gigantea]
MNDTHVTGDVTTARGDTFNKQAEEQMKAFYYILAFISVYIATFILCLLKYVKIRKKCFGEVGIYKPLLKLYESDLGLSEEAGVEEALPDSNEKKTEQEFIIM